MEKFICHAIELALEVKRFVYYDSYIARLTEQSRCVLFESDKITPAYQKFSRGKYFTVLPNSAQKQIFIGKSFAVKLSSIILQVC